MEYDEKIIDFEKWCKLCKHQDEPEESLPCRDCLDVPVNVNSTKPVKWEAKEK